MRKFLLLSFLLIASFGLRAQVPDYQFHRWFGSVVSSPEDIAVDKDDFMYLLDGKVINKLDAAGTWVKAFDVGNSTETFMALALDPAGNMYVLSNSNVNSNVRKYDPQGQLVLQFGNNGVLSGRFADPTGLAVDQEGNVYVSDQFNDRVHKFNTKGEFLIEIRIPTFNSNASDDPVAIRVGNSGTIYVLTYDYRIFKLSAAGQLVESFKISIPDLPASGSRVNTLALDEQENIYVSDQGPQRIHKLTSSGAYVQSYGFHQVAGGILVGAKIAVAVGRNGDVYVADKAQGVSSVNIFGPAGGLKKRIDNLFLARQLTQDYQGNFYALTSYPTTLIKKYNSYGTLLFELGKISPDTNQLWGPVALATDAGGNLYSLGSNDLGGWCRIQKFSSEGKYLAYFDPFGKESGSKRSTDIALDAQGNMYVTDYYGGCVRKISPTGTLLAKIADGSTGAGKVYLPRALTLDLKGNVYVADYNSNRIQKFSPTGQLLAVFYSPTPINENEDVPDHSLAVDLAGRIYSWNGRNPFILIFDAAGREIGRITGPSSELPVSGDFSLNRNGTRLQMISRHFIVEYLTEHAPRESLITGKVYQDADLNCVTGAGEKPLTGILVKAEPGPYFGISDEAGNYMIPVDTGTYTVRAILPEDVGRTITPTCPAAFGEEVRVSNYGRTVNGPDLGHQVSTAPVLSVSVSSNRRRRCFRNTTTLSYANTGFAPAANAQVTVQLPEFVSFISASVPHTRDRKGNYVFAVGNLQPSQRGLITLTDSVSCADPNIRGLTVCTKAWITPANTYPTPAHWNRADISVSGKTLEDSQARFVIRNNGPGDMTDSLFFRIYQDAELLLNSKYKLAAQDSLVLRFAPTGRALRLEADQPEGHPLKATAGVNVEVKPRFASLPSLPMMAFPPDDPEPEIAQDCLPIIDSFDPNDKQVVPAGLTSEHYTPTNTPLRYTIRFQNTGTDVAYRVVVVDTLSQDLDLGTLQVGAASHSYQLAVTGKTRPVLTFTFNNILLPDSASNQAGSNGFIQFSIKPKQGLPEKTSIENFADIFFDYNEPVRTNSTINRIYDMPLQVNAQKQLSLRQVVATPALTGFSPAQSRAGQKVKLTGRNFAATAADNRVSFNGMTATVLSATDSTLWVLVPADAFSGRIQVLTPDGGAQSSSDYVIFQPPTFTAVSAAEAVPGTVITLSGTHFSPVAAQDTVTFQGVPARVLEASETSLKVEVPAGAAFGKILVKTLGGQVESAAPFRVWYPPVITGLSPGKGKAGTIITLNGEHFAEAAARNQVQFGTAAAQVLEASAGRLLVQVPAAASSGRIRVQTPGGTAQSAADFTFFPAPEITAFSPVSGNAGTTVAITGRHFQADGQADTVYFNELPAKVLKATPTLLEVQAPKGLRSGTITVAGAGGKARAAGFEVPHLEPEQAIAIYPNPTKAAITINWFKADYIVESLQVYNAIGKMVAEADPGKAFDDELVLALSRFGAGVYTLRFRTSVGPVIKRVVVL